MAIKVQIFSDKLPSLDEMTESLKLPECGAVAIFSGKYIILRDFTFYYQALLEIILMVKK